jgi:hypothetical protein
MAAVAVESFFRHGLTRIFTDEPQGVKVVILNHEWTRMDTNGHEWGGGVPRTGAIM